VTKNAVPMSMPPRLRSVMLRSEALTRPKCTVIVWIPIALSTKWSLISVGMITPYTVEANPARASKKTGLSSVEKVKYAKRTGKTEAQESV